MGTIMDWSTLAIKPRWSPNIHEPLTAKARATVTPAGDILLHWPRMGMMLARPAKMLAVAFWSIPMVWPSRRMGPRQTEVMM